MDMPQEWRVLRFNNATRQSVVRVGLLCDGRVRQHEACLAFPYLKTMAAACALSSNVL